MSINIVLYNAGVIYSGGVVEGKVVCVLNSSKDIRAIRLKLRGKEHTEWEKRESYYDSEAKNTKWQTIYYSGDNKFLVVQHNLHGGGTIHAGRYEYPFRFVLPKNIPSTYQGAHGHIRYYLKANVDIPMGLDPEDEKTFIVKSLIDFNGMLDSIELNPTQYQYETNLCCCCCASDPITMELYLEKEAFVLGEIMRLKVHITNMSNESINQLTIRLERTTEEKCLHPRTDEKSETELLISNGSSGVGAHGDRDLHFELQIPQDLELPNFKCCELFSQWCTLKVEAVIPGCHSNLELETGITLGHVPVGDPNMRNAHSEGASNTLIPPLAPFPPSSQPYPPTCPPGDAAPPYPTGPSAFPIPSNNPGAIGFAVPGGDIPEVHKTNGVQVPYPPSAGAPYPPGQAGQPGIGMPYAPGSSSGISAPYPTANAPSDDSAPSAPPKVEMANDDFIILDGPSEDRNNEVPPPSYHEAMKTPKK